MISSSNKKVIKEVLIQSINQKSPQIRYCVCQIISLIVKYDFPDVWTGFMEKVCDQLEEQDDMDETEHKIAIDASLQAVIYSMQHDEKYHVMINKMLENLFSAFTSPQSDSKIREKCFEVYHRCLRCVSWADGIDEQVITTALDDTFNTWMTLFIQVIQSNPKIHFDIKKNALKCLTVIFRDMINYSLECINMVLQPAWKLLNVNLAVYTENVGYGKPIEFSEVEKANILQADNESAADCQILIDNEDDTEPGITGMTMQLIELLTSLSNKGSIRNLMFVGMVPLVTSVASYMILSNEQENEQIDDQGQFVYTDNTYDHTVRNSCLNFISQLIENFDDDAVEAILCVMDNFLLSMVENKEANVETSFDEVDVMKYTYNSSDKRHGLKKREVALFILGSLADDIIKYRNRKGHSNKSISNIFNSIVLPDLKNQEMPNILKGRSMWCATQLSGLMDDKDKN